MIAGFTDISFWIFFAVVLLGMSLFYNRLPIRNGFLFLCSLFFYFKAGGYFVGLLLFSIIINYLMAQITATSKLARIFCASFAIIINLLLLFYFKYIDFLNSLCSDIFGATLVAEQFSPTLLGLALPVGISFYTFTAISYIVDVYKRRTVAVKNFIDFGFYLSFFPTVLAGPILRATDIVPQLRKYYQVTSREFSIALFFILGGLVKKIVVADFIALQFVNRVFENPTLYTGLENWMAMYGYAVQIYCDFSGYTDIAIGLALLLGFKIPLNFNSPYKAASLTEFWHRWHISLSTWMRDYIYIPLGGNKKGSARTVINVFVTMVIGGLWHGAALKFVIWGAIHGVALVVEKIFLWTKITAAPKRIIGLFFTFHIVCFAWIFFRADSFDKALVMIEQLFTPTASSLEIAWQIIKNYAIVFSLIVITLVLHLLPSKVKKGYREVFYDLPLIIKFFAVLAVLAIIYFFKTTDLQPFIYFRF
ncbi:MAG: MBOAT family protein [Bacteroidales bacterium]|jgi:D-alanyl-lipoteichoic acid acyltransferase DltB (MBOAT superfamily)|nr:MBOAT family protein [Bacteroidales bacterium]